MRELKGEGSSERSGGTGSAIDSTYAGCKVRECGSVLRHQCCRLHSLHSLSQSATDSVR